MTPTTAVLRAWGAIIVSALASLTFLAALAISYLSKDQTNMSLMVGAVIANFTTVVSFWVGSSIGSQKKDDTIAAQEAQKS